MGGGVILESPVDRIREEAIAEFREQLTLKDEQLTKKDEQLAAKDEVHNKDVKRIKELEAKVLELGGQI